MRWSCRTSLLVLLLILLLLPAAQGHATPKETSPQQGAVLTEGATNITVLMTQRFDPTAASLELFDATLEPVPAQGPTFADNDHRLTLHLDEPLPRGGYIVKWQVLSAVDGHTTQGSWSFAVGDVNIPEVASGYTSPGFRVDAIIGKTLWYMGSALAIGAFVFVWWPLAQRSEALPHLHRLVGTAGILMVGGMTLFALSQWLSSGLGPRQYFGTTFGTALLWRTGLALAAGVAAVVAWRSDWPTRPMAWATLTPLAGALSLQAFFGHPAEFMPAGLLGVWLDLAHVLVIAAWIGGLLPLALYLGTMSGIERPERLAAASNRFSTLAMVAIVAATATGLWMSLSLVGATPDQYTDTEYGKALLVKVLLVVPVIAALGAVNRFLFLRHHRQHGLAADTFRRNVWREVAVAALVLLAAGSLTNLNPPVGEPQAQAVALPRATFFNETTGDTWVFHLYIDPGPEPGAESRFEFHVLDPETFRFEEVHSFAADAEHSEAGNQALPVKAMNETGKFDATGAFFSTAGEWQIQVNIRHASGERDAATFVVPVEP